MAAYRNAVVSANVSEAPCNVQPTVAAMPPANSAVAIAAVAALVEIRQPVVSVEAIVVEAAALVEAHLTVPAAAEAAVVAVATGVKLWQEKTSPHKI